jgi:N-acetylglucosamine transport system substrate-binding protein
MKKLQRAVCVLLGALSVVAGLLLTACGGKTDPDKTLFIEINNAGFGLAWIDPLIDLFKAENPGVSVKVTSMTQRSNDMLYKVLSGETGIDLFFTETEMALNTATNRITAGGRAFDSPYAYLTELFDTVIPGETATIAQKMIPEFLEVNTVGEGEGAKQYIYPYNFAPTGIVVNYNLYNEAEYGKLPNTTDELFAFCDALKSKAVTPFIHSLSKSYFNDMYEVWMAQYNGQANQKSFYQGYALYGAAKGTRYVPQMMLDEGLRAALRVMERLLLPANGYTSGLSNSLDFTSVQNRFLEGKDNILMMPNGLWLEREMEANYDPSELNIRFMRTPVVSALGAKLGITDAELSAVIEYCDGVAPAAPPFVSTAGLSADEVIGAVREARAMQPVNRLFAAVAPVYGTKLDWSKRFIQIMASDIGAEAMLRSNGSRPPIVYDIETSPAKADMSDFTLSVQRMQKGAKYYFSKMDPIFTAGGLQLINNISGKVSVLFGSSNAADRKPADTEYQDNYIYCSGIWQDILNRAGVSV